MFNVFLRRQLHLTLAWFDRARGASKPLITVLCYHSVENDNWLFSTPESMLETQLAYLAKQYQFISLDELQAYLEAQQTITKPSILITFDDGYQNLLAITPLLKKYGVKPAVFVISHPTAVNKKELQSNLALLTPSQIKLLFKSGWQVGSHTATHPNLSTLSDSRLVEELSRSYQTITELTGQACTWIAFPRGKYTDKVITQAQKSGYRYGLTMDDGFISRQTPAFNIPRIGINQSHALDEFAALNAPSCIRVRNLIKKIIGFAL